MNAMSYIGKEKCHKEANYGDLCRMVVCEVCGEEYEKKIEEEK
ncbi:MAG: hypothetical protein ACW990_00250 [Promethearchaeota archaeon]|jgi:hypothetical protein